MESPVKRTDRNGICFGLICLLTLSAALLLKTHYSLAGSQALDWVLAPTARLAGLFSGLDFAREAGTGYVCPAGGVIIAPACAGVNFMIVAFCLAAFTGLGRAHPVRRNLAWVGFSAAAAYLLTVAVNALRIAVAVRLYAGKVQGAWLDPDGVHRLAGVLIYLTALCLFHRWLRGLTAGAAATPAGHGRRRWITWTAPAAWYGAVTVVVPWLNGAWTAAPERFVSHLWTVGAGCWIALGLAYLLQRNLDA